MYTYAATFRSPEAWTLVARAANGGEAFRTATEAGTREVVAKIPDQLFLAEPSAVQPAQEDSVRDPQ